MPRFGTFLVFAGKMKLKQKFPVR